MNGGTTTVSCSPALLLLDVNTYNPDTLNLQNDVAANEYWFTCIGDLVKKFAKQAAYSQRNDSTANERAELYKDQLLDIISCHKDEK